MEECFGEGPFIFRLNDTGSGPPLLTQVCLERGWKEFKEENGENWNLWWKAAGFSTSHHKNLLNTQYINHIPKGSSICRKDNLVRNLRCMKKIYGAIYDFSPHGYNLPLEYTKLATECSRIRLVNTNGDLEGYYEDKPVWICKPVAQSQGRGIFLFRKLSELNYDTNTIVQRYIERPLLIGGYKFDLRLYVCIPCYHPLTVYMYREGLARFGTDKFSLNDLRNPYRHLTNCSINKLGPGYAEMKDRIGSGCKWTLKQLRKYFRQARIKDWLIWQKVSSLVVLTLLAHVAHVPQTLNCFDFFGFDVLIDETLKPWLLEVNLSPALGYDCDTDRYVKKPMLHDMFDLLGLPLYNTGLSVFNIYIDDYKENSSDDLNVVSDVKSVQNSVANAIAGRWRRRQKKSASQRPKSSSRSKSKIRISPSVSNEKSSGRLWGNERDWTNPVSQEGGWIRLCPYLDNTGLASAESTSVKHLVSQVMKFCKTAKDVAKTYPMASECQLNEFLLAQMEMNGEIWIPPI